MFAYMKGLLSLIATSYVILETGGIGYKIFLPLSAFGRLSQLGELCCLNLSFVVREQSHTLYGFITLQERDFFEELLGVTGIGPKTALALIGHISLGDLQTAIVNQNTAAICKVPGIGKKGAERLIIEMRDKIDLKVDPKDFAVNFSIDPRNRAINDAMSALINLGYNQAVAQRAIKKSLKDSSEDIDLASLISQSLKHV